MEWLLRSRSHSPPSSLRALEIGLRLVQKKLQRGTACKTVPLAAVRIDPIEGTVRFDSRSRGDAERIEAVEFALHRRRGHSRFPDTIAAPVGDGTPRRRSAEQRQTTCDQLMSAHH